MLTIKIEVSFEVEFLNHIFKEGEIEALNDGWLEEYQGNLKEDLLNVLLLNNSIKIPYFEYSDSKKPNYIKVTKNSMLKGIQEAFLNGSLVNKEAEFYKIKEPVNYVFQYIIFGEIKFS